ncbi:uncharacterized protein LOC141858821 [Acropora palmata]|uniref:uncharacterized protein LOC141858821 n=1 Tax=Acropora palmata TaxID=6131 RepID=UPI003DA1B1D5
MSRRSSASSSISTSAKSGVEDDPLMRDCYDLRRRLLQTEQSLQSLNPPHASISKPRSLQQKQVAYENRTETVDRNYHAIAEDLSLNGPRGSYSSSPESAAGQVLTLADLTPAGSEPNLSSRSRRGTPLIGPSQPLRSSYPDLRHGSTHVSPRERDERDALESHSFGSISDYDHDTMVKKLSKQREENSQLVTQNHKLMTELENMSYELHQAKNKVKIVSQELEVERKRLPPLEDRIVHLESDLASQEDAVRFTEQNLHDCREELQSKTEELKSVLESSTIAENELREEATLRKRTEDHLEEALRNVEEMSERIAEQDSTIQTLRKEQNERDRNSKESNSKSQREREQLLEKEALLQAQIIDLQEEIRLLQAEGAAKDDCQTSMQHENTSLRATISRQSQKIGRMENELKKNEMVLKDQGGLQSTVDKQREKILKYQREIEETKHHMARLEDLVHQVQEQSMKEHVTTTPSTSDSGICSSTQTMNGYHHMSPRNMGSYIQDDTENNVDHVTGSGGSSRAVIADLKLKLAMKEAEIQKLQATAVARAAAQQKHIAGLAGDGGVMDGLRTELSAIVERSRIGDRKQQELEQVITRLEDEVARHSSQTIQLEERLADKMAQIASLESKLGQRNLKVVDLQNELEEKISENNVLQREVRQATSHLSSIEKQLNERASESGLHSAKLKELQEEIEIRSRKIGQLEGSLEAKDIELKESATLVERVKALHGEQCHELQKQIEELQRSFEEKNAVISRLETSLAASRQELNLKKSVVDQMERAMKEQKQEIESRDVQSVQRGQKLEKLEEQAEQATQQVRKMEDSLAECHREIEVYVEQLKDARTAHDQEMEQKRLEMSKLEKALQHTASDLRQKNEQIVQLKGIVAEQQNSLRNDQDKVREIEESRAQLQQQMAILEEEINRERNTAQVESTELQQRLQEAKDDIDERTRQINELSSTLSEVHKDMKHSSASIVELEQLLQQSRTLCDKKTAQAQTLDQALKETQKQLSATTKKNGELEERLRQMESEFTATADRNAQLDNEVNKIQAELQDTISQLKSLQDVLQASQKEKQEKEKKVEELDKKLNESMEELQQKDKNLKEKESRVVELDKALKDRQWELKQKAAQVTQLDMTMKEHKSELQQKVIALDHALNQARYELSERAVEISELKAKLDRNQEQEKQKKIRIDHLEKTVKHQQQELKKRASEVSDFEKEINKLRKRREDSEETSQELRLAREQLQNTHAELMEARRELLKCQRTEQELVHELDDAHALLTTKETDCTRLAKELGAAQVREAQAEARCVQEIRRAQQQQELKQVTQEHEVQRLREDHVKVIAEKDEKDAHHRLKLQELQEREQKVAQELSRAKEKNMTLIEDNRSLASQLVFYQEDAKTTSENLVIKDAEIARLEAKLSGYERATFGSSSRITTPRGPRSATHMRRVTSPRTVTKSSVSGMKKSNSDQNLENLTDGGPLVSFSHANSQHVIESHPYSPMPAIFVSQDHGHSVYPNTTYTDRTRSVQSSLETLEGLLKQANMEMARDSFPMLLNSSTSQITDVTLNASDLSSTQPSPPQKEEREQNQPVVNGRVGDEGSHSVSGDFENLHEQLDRKKASLGLSRDKAKESDSLDPEKCRASLQQRLALNEARRKNIDQQLLEMQQSETP